MPDSSLIPQLSRALMLWALCARGVIPAGPLHVPKHVPHFIRYSFAKSVCKSAVRLLRRDSESECFMKSYKLHLIPRDLLSNSAG